MDMGLIFVCSVLFAAAVYILRWRVFGVEPDKPKKNEPFDLLETHPHTISMAHTLSVEEERALRFCEYPNEEIKAEAIELGEEEFNKKYFFAPLENIEWAHPNPRYGFCIDKYRASLAFDGTNLKETEHVQEPTILLCNKLRATPKEFVIEDTELKYLGVTVAELYNEYRWMNRNLSWPENIILNHFIKTAMFKIKEEQRQKERDELKKLLEQ